MEKISVCIATYNGEKYIYKQLDSILSQLNEYDEVIVSDDFSTDNTIFEVNRFNDNRIKIVFNYGEKGYTSNFENALRYAVGDIVFLSDQDDIWVSNKVNYCVEILKNNDFVVTDCMLIDENDNIKTKSYYRGRKPFTSIVGNLFKFGYLGCCFAFRKKVLQKALPFPTNHTYCTHDNWLQLVSMVYFKYSISDEKMILYRRHNSNTSTGGFSSTTNCLFKVKYRIYLLFHLFKRSFK